ncbi:MAG: TIGR03067 domain-containing protein [Planctomycetia bacterium]|nr:TIGR03067 domain-containing protein [Planctomycetia bacterium]
MMLVLLSMCCLLPQDSIAQEVQKLNGTWHVVRSETDGKDFSSRLKGYQYVFDGQFIKLLDAKGKAVLRSDNKPDERPFLINVLTNPKTMDMTIQIKSKSFMSLGIYRLEGDELQLCFAEPGSQRPNAFQSKDGTTLIALKRAKK